MSDQKGKKKKKKKKNLAEIFGIFECLLPQTHLMKTLYSLDSSRSYGRVLENPKTGASRNLFLLESDFKISSTVNFLKKYPDFGGLKTNQRHETQTRIFFLIPFDI